MLKKENNYDFRKRMLKIHDKNIRDYEKASNEDDFVIENGFMVVVGKDADDVIITAARDFIDYLFDSMGVAAMLIREEEATDAPAIRISVSDNPAKDLGKSAGYRGFKIEFNGNTINVTAYDSRGAAQALYRLEDLMSFRKAPYLKRETVCCKAMYGPQMVHSGYGLDEYPNEHLAAIAHEGRDAILVFVKDVNITPYGYLDFNELIYRAEKYGIDVYAYSYFKSEMHPDEKGAEAHYESTYGRLFKECPKLKGVTLVGESVEFPSKDPHVTGHHYWENTVEGIPTGKTSPGWFPCCDFPQWLNLIKKIIRKYNSEADIVFWTYNWGMRKEEDRLALIENLPTDISLMATFEMFEILNVEGARDICADYTLSFAGPGGYFKSEAKAAREKGIRLYSMTNTGGLTWDIGVIPYEPFPYQWIERYKGMEKANKEWGLCGLMESHHYGFYPSFISKLSKFAFFEPHEDYEKILKDILIGEYDEENFEAVDKALRLWSKAITYYTPTNADQYGAFRVGPSYPLCLERSIKPPALSYSMFGNGIMKVPYYMGCDDRCTYLSIRIEREWQSLEKMRAYIAEGLEILGKIENKNEKLLYLENMGKFILFTTISGINAKKWYSLVTELRAEKNVEKLFSILDELEKLVDIEETNARNTIPVVGVDSRLGWEPSMEYMTDEKHLDWKLRQLDYARVEINNERRSLSLSL